MYIQRIKKRKEKAYWAFNMDKSSNGKKLKSLIDRVYSYHLNLIPKQ